MIKLKVFLGLVFLVTLGCCTEQRRNLMFPDPEGFNSPDVNTQCPYLREFRPARYNGVTAVNRLQLADAVIVQKLVVDTTLCNADRDLIERNFSVHYEDASDKLKQKRLYSDNLFGRWGLSGARIEISLDPVLYTDHVTLSSSSPVQCSSILLLGCTPHEICPQGTCRNNGKCVGNGRCACEKGFMGRQCEVPVSKMPFDDYDIVAAIPHLLLTKDAAFDVSGDVDFSIVQPEDQTRQRRSHHSGHHGHHGSSCHFHGHGGSCYHSSSHNGGYSNSVHSTYGHHSSNSYCSSVLTSPSGYSHTAQISYGHNHHHGGTHYIYTTHGTSHYSHGASLHYCNNQLSMHVHNTYHNHYNGNHGHHTHYHVQAPFYPKPGVAYHVCSSYSPQYGASIHVNGKPLASQCKPTQVPTSPAPTHAVPTPPTQGPLCFGSCGAPTGSGHHSYTMSNIGVAGGSLPLLATNMLLGLLGPAMLNALLHMVPTVRPTTSANAGFTLAPTTSVPKTTTSPPASATTAGLGAVTTRKYAPVCYDCMHVNNTGSCSSVMQCNHGETCLILHDKFGYTQRCMNKQDCDKGLSKTLADCWNCCHGNLCNDKCTPSKSTSTNCKDELQCFSLKNLGAYYNVCRDPVYSTTVCRKSCGHCP